jgi:hypothetical protein
LGINTFEQTTTSSVEENEKEEENKVYTIDARIVLLDKITI